MAEDNKWKSVLAVWLNPNKDGKGCYLSIKNESNKPIIIEPGKSIFANMANRPIASKSVKVEEVEEHTSSKVADSIPF